MHTQKVQKRQETIEESLTNAWQENRENHHENSTSWVEDLEDWQRTLGAREDPLKKGVIVAFLVIIIIVVVFIVLVKYIRDVA